MTIYTEQRLKRCYKAIQEGPCDSTELSYRISSTFRTAGNLARALEARGMVRSEMSVCGGPDHHPRRVYYAIEEAEDESRLDRVRTDGQRHDGHDPLGAQGHPGGGRAHQGDDKEGRRLVGHHLRQGQG